MAELKIHQFICRSDNFGVLIHDDESGVTASIDTPDPDPIRRDDPAYLAAADAAG